MAENGGSEDRVKFQISVEGSEEAAEAFARLGDQIEDTGDAAETASARQERLDATSRAAAVSAINFTTKLAGVANAVGELSAMLGEQNNEVRLIGKIAATSAQMAQLGNMAGPQGAVVGGIVGALIPAFIEFRSQLEATHRSTEDVIASFERAATAANTASGILGGANAIANQRREAEALANLTSVFGNEQQRLDVLEFQRRQLVTMRNEQRAIREAHGAAVRAELAAERSRGGLGQAFGEEIDRSQSRILQQRADSMLEQIRQVRANIRELEAAQRTASSAIQIEAQNITGRDGRARRGGGGDSVDLVNGMTAETAAALARAQAAQAAFEAESIQRTKDGAHELFVFRENLRQQENDAAIEDARKLMEAQIDANKRAADARAAIDAKERQRRDRDIERNTKMLEQYASPIGKVFGDAFEQAINGQEDFGKAFEKGSKQMLTQFGTQMVAEGVGALLTSVGMIAVNPGGAPMKAAEGAGKIALGVSLGAAGAAIQTGAEAPAANGNAPSAQAGGGNVVVNLNAPTVVGGTHAETGRMLGRSLAEGRARFNGRAAA